MVNKEKSSGSGLVSDYSSIKAEIRSGKIRNLYVLFGEEDFLIENLVNSLQSAVLNPAGADLDRVRFDVQGQTARLDLTQLKAEIMTPPFLSVRKFVLVRNSGLFQTTAGGANADSEGLSQKQRQGELESCLEALNDRCCLVFVEQKLDKRLKGLLHSIQNYGVAAEMKLETPRKLCQWIEAEFRKRQLQIETVAAESLADRCDHRMRTIGSEMEKIFLYLRYRGQTVVRLNDIDALSLPDLRGNVFELTDAISDGKTAQALQLLDNLIQQKQPVQLIQFMLARHFRQLICASEIGRADLLAAKLKVMPFVANRLVRQSRNFSVQVIERIYALCLESDLMVKTGKMADRLALETLLIRSGEAAAYVRQH